MPLCSTRMIKLFKWKKNRDTKYYETVPLQCRTRFLCSRQCKQCCLRILLYCRDWGWEVVQAIEKHCRLDSGYVGLKNVNKVSSFTSLVVLTFVTFYQLEYIFSQYHKMNNMHVICYNKFFSYIVNHTDHLSFVCQ